MFIRSTRPRLFGLTPVLFAASDDSGQGGADTGDADTDAGGTGGNDKTFTQAELDRIVGRRASESEKASKRALLEALGVKDEAEAKKIIEAQRKAAEKDRTDLERAQSKATEHETAAQQARREANEAKLQLRIDRKLLAAGADPARLERLSKTVFVDLDDDADDDAITAAIDGVKTDFAEAFASKDAGDGDQKRKTGPAPSGTAANGKGPAKGGSTSDALTRGRDRARRLQGRDTAEAKTA